MRITTTYKTQAGTGAGQILAKGGGKQRTVNYDPALTAAANHGAAAGALGAAHGAPFKGVTIMLSMDNGNARFDLA